MSYEREKIYSYERDGYSTDISVDNADQCVFFNTAYPVGSTPTEQIAFLEEASERTMIELEKEYEDCYRGGW
jgi:hypothetical protein